MQEASTYYGRSKPNALKNYVHLSDTRVALHKGCTNSGHQVVQTTNVCKLVLNICGSSAWNVRYVTVLATVIFSDDPPIFGKFVDCCSAL